jgi:hypothetical protein
MSKVPNCKDVKVGVATKDVPGPGYYERENNYINNNFMNGNVDHKRSTSDSVLPHSAKAADVIHNNINK